MSVRVLTRVWDHSRHRSTELLLMLAFADIAHDDGLCWPSVDMLARKARIGRSTVKRLIHRLLSSGELQIVEAGGGRRSNRYVVTLATAVQEVMIEPSRSKVDRVQSETGLTRGPAAGPVVDRQQVHSRGPGTVTQRKLNRPRARARGTGAHAPKDEGRGAMRSIGQVLNDAQRRAIRDQGETG